MDSPFIPAYRREIATKVDRTEMLPDIVCSGGLAPSRWVALFHLFAKGTTRVVLVATAGVMRTEFADVLLPGCIRCRDERRR